MLLFSAMLASAAPLPLPAHADAGPIEGFVAVWVEPNELPASLEPVAPAEPAEPEAGPHDHGAAPKGLAVLGLDEGVARAEIIKAIEDDEQLVSVKLNDDGTAILVDHPDLVALLARPLGKGTVGDAVSLHPVPTGILKMPTPPKPEGPKAAGTDLPVENTASARAVVSIGGVEIGEIGPYATGVIHGVKPGTYELEFRLPNGYVRTARAVTGSDLGYEAPYRMR